MQFRVPFTALSAVLLMASVAVSSSQAETVVINANQDTYIRSGGTNANTNFNGLKLITGTYFPLVQFDLSGVTGEITSAYIRGYLFQDPDNDFSTTNYQHQLYLSKTDPNNSAYDGGMVESTMTYNTYVGIWNDNEALMSSLGSFTQDTAGTPNQYYDFGAASPADLTELNTRATLSNVNQRFALFFVQRVAGETGWRWWSDHEAGQPMQLVLEVVPEPSAIVLTAIGCVFGVVAVRRKQRS